MDVVVVVVVAVVVDGVVRGNGARKYAWPRIETAKISANNVVAFDLLLEPHEWLEQQGGDDNGRRWWWWW